MPGKAKTKQRRTPVRRRRAGAKWSPAELKMAEDLALVSYKKRGPKKGPYFGGVAKLIGRKSNPVKKQLGERWLERNTWHRSPDGLWHPGPERVYETHLGGSGKARHVEKTGAGKDVWRYVKHKGKYYKYDINEKKHVGRPFDSYEKMERWLAREGLSKTVIKEQKKYNPDMPEYAGGLDFMDQKKKSWYRKNPFARASKTRQQKKQERTAEEEARKKFEKKQTKDERRSEATKKRRDYNEREEARKGKKKDPEKMTKREKRSEQKKKDKEADELESERPKERSRKRKSTGVSGFARRTMGALPGVSRTRWGRERRSHGRKKRRRALAEAEKEEELRGREYKIEQARARRRTQRTRARAEERAWKRGDYI